MVNLSRALAVATIGYCSNLAIFNYHTTQPVGFQTLVSEAHDPTRLGGTLCQALSAGVNLGAKFIEIYQDDADAAANQQLLASESALLK